MQKLGIVIAVLIIASLSGQVYSQGLHFGIRAGVNYTKYQGPLETNEKYKLNNGFHFGLNVEYALNDIVSIKSEFMYIQNGTKKQYSGDSYYFFDLDPSSASNFNMDFNSRVLIKDDLQLNLDISNAYIGLPITAHFRTLDKWDIYGGAYVNFMISSIGRGIIEFGGEDDESLDHQFQQGLDYNYRNDISGSSGIPNYSNNDVIRLIGNDLETITFRFSGAYYQFPQQDRINAFKAIDYGLVGGVNHFLNPGLFIGLRLEYGLRDITDNRVDRSLQEINTDNSLILRDDNDKHLGVNLSLGFRF